MRLAVVMCQKEDGYFSGGLINLFDNDQMINWRGLFSSCKGAKEIVNTKMSSA